MVQARWLLLLAATACALALGIPAVVWLLRHSSSVRVVWLRGLRDGFLFREPVAGEENFLFLETSCAADRANESSALLTARQACAVESAARHHPHASVYLLHTCPLTREKLLLAPEYLRLLITTHRNVYLRHLNYTEAFAGSLLADWFRQRSLIATLHPVENMSNFLRLLQLRKYGGTYLDLDVVVMRSLSGMINFAGAEHEVKVGNAVLSLAHNGSGHKMARVCLESLKEDFRGDRYSNGPRSITRVLQRVCAVKRTMDMTTERCHGFTVFPQSAFYPIPWKQWELYFREQTSNETMSRLRGSLAIHVWNKLSAREPITVGSRQPYGLVAQRHCPGVYSHCGSTF